MSPGTAHRSSPVPSFPMITPDMSFKESSNHENGRRYPGLSSCSVRTFRNEEGMLFDTGSWTHWDMGIESEKCRENCFGE